jgi:hypothetical protein
MPSYCRCRSQGTVGASNSALAPERGCGPEFLADDPAVDQAELQAIGAAFLKAYRWQYIHSGAQHSHFGKVLSSLITEDQGQRIQAALATLQ